MPAINAGAKIADLEEKVTGTTTAPVETETETTVTTTAAEPATLGEPFDRRLAVDGKGNPRVAYAVEGALLSLTPEWAGSPANLRKLLVDNAARLYGFSV